MKVFKGAIHCETCHMKILVLGGKALHVDPDGTLKLIQGHGKIVGGGR